MRAVATYAAADLGSEPLTKLLSESTLTLAQAAALVPPSRGANRTCLSTVLRWIVTGLRGPAGKRVRLEAVRFGGRWITSRVTDRLTPKFGGADEKPAA